MENIVEELLLPVSGMTCAGCERRIRTALERLPGVRDSAADHQTGEVCVTLDPTHSTPADVRESIEQAGYAVAQ